MTDSTSRQFSELQYGKDERYTQNAPEPKDEQDADDHGAAAYAASCENRLNISNTFTNKAGKVKNIEDIAGEM